MAKLASAGTRIYVDQYALSGFLNSVDMAVKQELADVACFSDAGPRRLVGNYDHSHSLAGFFDGTAAQIDEIVHSLLDDDDHYLLELFGASAAGNIAYESIVHLANKPIKAAVGAGILLDQTLEGSGGQSRGLVILNATVSGDGNQTGQNVGASASGQTFQVVVRVISGTFTSFDCNIEQSQNDGGADPYAAVAGLSKTGIVAAGVYRQTVTAATEAWKRVVIANWIGTSAVVVVTAGIVTGT